MWMIDETFLSDKESEPVPAGRQGIEGVRIKELVTHSDDRGFFREIIRSTDKFFEEAGGFGQWSYSLMYQETIKAWHLHSIQYDFWHVPFGTIKAVLFDLRVESSTYHCRNEFMMGDNQAPIVLRIPPGVAHGLKVLQGPASLFYITSEVYNPADEGRLPHHDPEIAYDWLARPEIS